jgi:hypothetical protein
MKFKKGDIVESKQGHSRVVFQLNSNAKYDYYITPYGHYSRKKSWWASGIHIDGIYKGTPCSVFHLENCTLVGSFGLTKTLKEFSMTE